MRLSIDTSVMSFVAACPPEPAVNLETKAQILDDTARPIYQVHLFVVGAGCRDAIRVKVPGEPKGIGEFTPVKLAELVATRCHGRQGGH